MVDNIPTGSTAPSLDVRGRLLPDASNPLPNYFESFPRRQQFFIPRYEKYNNFSLAVA